MSDQDDPLKKQIGLGQRLVAALDKLLSTGDWDFALLLKSTKKRLQVLRDQAQALVDKALPAKSVSKGGAITAKAVHREGYQVIYISLYQSEGANLSKWEGALKSIEGHTISRPVYGREDDAKAFIRAKTRKDTEAYVAIYVDESSVIPPYLGKPVQDRLGHELLTIRQGAVMLSNVAEFVHEGKHYHFHEGKLIPIG